MNIEYLNEFHQLMNYPSITKAASMMGISQPVLSRHIQALEKELHTPLLIRGSQHIEFTGAGIILIARLQELLPYWEQSKELVIEAGKKENKIVIGGNLDNTLIKGRIYAASEISRQDMRPLNVVFQEDAGIESLKNRSIDVLVSYPLPPEELWGEPFSLQPAGTSSVSAVVTRDHHLADRNALTLSDLKTENIIRLVGDHFSYDLWWNMFTNACKTKGFDPKNRSVFVRDLLQTPTFFIGKDVFLCATEGLQSGFWRGNPLYISIPITDMHIELNMYYRADNNSSALSQFLDIVSSFNPEIV